MKKLLVIFLLCGNSLFAANVEYISGYMSYRYITGGVSFPKYEITLTLFTKYQKLSAATLTANHVGNMIFIDSILIGNNIVKSRYQITLTYNSFGNYIAYCSDTINIQSVLNVSLSSPSKFSISSVTIVTPFVIPPNNSFIDMSSPALKIFKNKPFSFNPISSTYNTFEYDSIVNTFYSSYDYRVHSPSGAKINRYSGEIQWPNPDTLGSYSFAIQSLMYKNSTRVEIAFHNYQFEVINQSPSYIYDSIDKVPVNTQNFKEFFYTAGNTYSFSTVYTDPVADSVKMITYPIDFFTTPPMITVIKNSVKKNTLNFSWSPTVPDERLYPYNFVLQSVSYYPNDSVANSYQTVSFRSSRITALKQNEALKNVVVFPNPVSTILNIVDEQNDLQNSTIQITNSLGQTVLQLPFNNKVDVSSLCNGYYFLNFKTSQNQIFHSKFIKE